MNNRLSVAKVYTTLPFVPMMKTTQEGPPPTLPYVPIEVRIPEDKRRRAQDEYNRLRTAFADALTYDEVVPLPLVPIKGVVPWGELLVHEAYSLWRKSTMPFNQRDPYDTTDDLDLTEGDRYLGHKIEQYLPTAPVTSRPNYMPPSDGVWDRGPTPDNEHTTEGEHDMNDDTTPAPATTPLITITDGNTGGINVPNPDSVTLPYVDSLYNSPVPMKEPSTEGRAPFTTYLEYLTTIKTLYATLKANGTHKQAGIALAVLSANWLGDMLYHMVPFSGVPMTVGVLCLSSLLLRSNREKLVRVLKEYVE